MLTALMIASAITVQASSPDDIVVIGRKPLDRSEAQKAVNAITVSQESQIARFHDPVCPLVVGLPMEARQVVEEEIRSVARSVGARVAGARCEANLIVMLAGDKQAMFADIRKTRPKWLEVMSHREAEKIAAQPGPVLAWAVRTLRDEDGRILKVTGDRSGSTSSQVRGASILKQTTSVGIQGAVIIIERAAVDGRSLGEIGQYAAMRGLAVTRVPSSGSDGTILGMFSSTQAPRQLTGFDRTYLRALYSGDGRDLAVMERSRIAKAVAGPAH